MPSAYDPEVIQAAATILGARIVAAATSGIEPATQEQTITGFASAIEVVLEGLKIAAPRTPVRSTRS